MTPEVQEHPKLVEARERLAQAKEGFEKAEAAVARAEERRDKASREAARAIAKGDKPKRFEHLPDPLALAGAVNEHREAIKLAEQAERDALAEAKREVLSKLQQEHIAAVKDLSKKLEAAAAANAQVRALEERAQMVRLNGSSGLPHLSWSELVEESPTRASKFSTWKRQAESYLKTHAASIPKRLLRRRR